MVTGRGAEYAGVDEAVSLSVEATPPADAVTSASPCPDEETSLPVDADPSLRALFVEPVVGARTADHHVESSADDHDERLDNEDALFMTVSEGEPYRPLPECPSPAPESEEVPEATLEIAPCVLVEQEAASVPVEPDVPPGVSLSPCKCVFPLRFASSKVDYLLYLCNFGDTSMHSV
jgi:hypothetical protein